MNILNVEIAYSLYGKEQFSWKGLVHLTTGINQSLHTKTSKWRQDMAKQICKTGWVKKMHWKLEHLQHFRISPGRCSNHGLRPSYVATGNATKKKQHMPHGPPWPTMAHHGPPWPTCMLIDGSAPCSSSTLMASMLPDLRLGLRVAAEPLHSDYFLLIRASQTELNDKLIILWQRRKQNGWGWKSSNHLHFWEVARSGTAYNMTAADLCNTLDRIQLQLMHCMYSQISSTLSFHVFLKNKTSCFGLAEWSV